MTRKHFRAIAENLRAQGAGLTPEAFQTLCESMADLLATTNPRFNRARFLAACGVTS